MEDDSLSKLEKESQSEQNIQHTNVYDLAKGLLIIFGVEIVLCLMIVIKIIFYSKGKLTGFEIEPNDLMFATTLSGINTLVVCWHFTCGKYDYSFFEGLNIKKITLKHFILSFIVGVLFSLIGFYVSSQVSTGESPISKYVSTDNGLINLCIMSLILPPIEEIYYRGFIFQALQTKFTALPTIIIVSLWFGLAHSFQLLGDSKILIVIIFMGSFLTLQRYFTKSLLPSIISHWSYNGSLAFISLYNNFG
ncbi:MAG: CPBP family intramembrane metalloprotease [Acidobacteria bacterium]|nr:CPBP family intramembrane metalloprotease [Acidobacteriota bacterium]